MPVKALVSPGGSGSSATDARMLTRKIAQAADNDAEHYFEPPLEYLTLPDGRRLAYSVFGRPDGFPILYFHSAGSSRLECALFECSARRLGFRLIAADRPGIGGSDFLPGVNHRDISEEMLMLADHLEISRFGLMSHSSGGVFALAMAHRFPSRIRFVLSLGGVAGNVGWQENRKGSLLALLARGVLPGLIGVATRVRHRLAQVDAWSYMDCLQAELSYTDRKALADPDVSAILRSAVAESCRQGVAGVARDNSLCFEDPGIRLQQIEVPVSFWQGRADMLCSRSFTEYLAARIPMASCHSVPNRGHFFFIHSMDEIFERTRVFTRSAVSRACPSVP